MDQSAEASTSSGTRRRPTLSILYASATGTAEDLAHRVSRLAQRYHFQTEILSFDSLDLVDLEYLCQSGDPALFLVATAGNGSFPLTAESLWSELLSTSLVAGSSLKGLNYAIFGLGDSSYPRFCWPERMMSKRLVNLGANEMEKGEGDMQHYLGIEGTFQPFLESLFGKLEQRFPRPPGLSILPEDAALPPSLELRFLDGDDIDSQLAQSLTSSISLDGEEAEAAHGPDSCHLHHHEFSPHIDQSTRWLKLTRNERVTTEDHFQDVRLLEFVVSNDGESGLDYEPGDVAALRPANDPEMVDALIERMGWGNDRNRPVAIFDQRDRRAHLPLTVRSQPRLLTNGNQTNGSTSASGSGSGSGSIMTLHDYITFHTSPFASLRPSLFPLLRPFTPKDHMEREKLDEFCTPGDGYDEAMDYGVRTKRTTAEVLEEFRSVQFAPRWAPEIFASGSAEEPREREFSIASSPSLDGSGRVLQLLVAIVSYRTRIREPRKGVATRWISSLEPGMMVPVAIHKSSILRLPPDDATPIILVGPGTGMAPIRGLARERVAKALRKEGSADRFGEAVCFFGCRDLASDGLLKSEWDQLEKQAQSRSPPVQLKVHWASSRVDPNTGRARAKGEKVYVQDVIRSHGQQLAELMFNKGAWVYISGSSGAMPRQVREAFEDIIQDSLGLEEDQAKRMVDKWEREGRWREECWS